jgi:hypothetical protein
LGALARTKTGAEQERLLEMAWGKVVQAAELASSHQVQELEALYCAHLVHIGLFTCCVAIQADNRGHARSSFESALDRLPRAVPKLAQEELVGFFRGMVGVQTADLCAEFFATMKARDMRDELELLTPFAMAVEYWQKGEDEEVLDRLNPEVRRIVEAIIRGEDKGHPSR